ncbi:tetratricopeptide repeat protein [Paludibacter sp. 221]|uniref:tetratricopeptide repeat protein n=1 Tax=Paludibacter sp. 221 TaxID=2302939 RepID=UPI0013D37F32|nr:tetratricopeptide repeat protein [Paludibacter sp. 221]NDV47226.1 tetratricopeptide repeat protein [Paludibacter sp. 221]
MSKQVKNKRDEFENVEHALTTSEAFIEKYRKQILIGVGAVVLVVLVILSVRNFYLKPREVSAENEMYRAQTYFAVDSFYVALNGDGLDCIGFKEIVSDYGMTPSGNLAAAYAGICYYKLNDYQNAIKYLSQFDGKDTYLTTSVVGMIGDCYAETGDTNKAISHFEKASSLKNAVISPIYLKKAGLAYESIGEAGKAEKCYTEIKNSYAQSQEASDIDKYIARVSK